MRVNDIYRKERIFSEGFLMKNALLAIAVLLALLINGLLLHDNLAISDQIAAHPTILQAWMHHPAKD